MKQGNFFSEAKLKGTSRVWWIRKRAYVRRAGFRAIKTWEEMKQVMSLHVVPLKYKHKVYHQFTLCASDHAHKSHNAVSNGCVRPRAMRELNVGGKPWQKLGISYVECRVHDSRPLEQPQSLNLNEKKKSWKSNLVNFISMGNGGHLGKLRLNF
ncbi:hypothetical protein M9H77_21102 [Catharanthus roseus]|uniref:Uncharacterized protein n=1 Tax=Catharanthus roseus TaxID=4058 RepID=A0ACC0ALT8_CATRO|nr:hypothetical protein M9H77_21102 [Catharanthus roseus]